MNVRHEAILIRFPEYKDRLLHEIGENEDFECLCSDYGECVELLERMNLDSNNTNNIIEQYGDLKMELEREVLKFLSR